MPIIYNLDYKWEELDTFIPNVQSTLGQGTKPEEIPPISTVVTFEIGPPIKLNMAEVIYFHTYFNNDDRVKNYENNKLVVYLKSGGLLYIDNKTVSAFENLIIPDTQ